jgi:hypothetical protein
MALSKRAYEGELLVDHRASPGLTNEQAHKLGYTLDNTGVPNAVAEGKVFEAPTMGCNHCGTVVIINPSRTRDRAYCPSCDHYICDNCELERKLPDYKHATHRQKIENYISANTRIII